MRPPRALLALALFVLVWPLVAYPLVLALIARLRARTLAARTLAARTPAATSATELPEVTVIVPTHGEAASIVPRLQNLGACNYPRDRLRAVVVDSGSADGTADLAEAFARGCELSVRVIREPQRAGKAAAINRAIAFASSGIVVITDAPTTFEPGALERVARAFDDPEVGAATGEFEVTGEGGVLQREEQRFWRIRNRLRQLESAVDSTPFLSGEMCAFRRELVPRLDDDTLADDMNVALRVRRLGYRAIVVRGAVFSERRSHDAHELMETKSRRAAGGVQELIRNRDLAGNPAFGLFGLLIMPSALLTYMPLRVPALAVLGWEAARRFRAMHASARLAAVILAAAAAPALVRRYGETVWMLFFNEWIFVQGWRRILSRRMDVQWEQERSTRERTAAEPRV